MQRPILLEEAADFRQFPSPIKSSSIIMGYRIVRSLPIQFTKQSNAGERK